MGLERVTDFDSYLFIFPVYSVLSTIAMDIMVSKIKKKKSQLTQDLQFNGGP